jgi:putative peptide zinc metalloprotease protein
MAASPQTPAPPAAAPAPAAPPQATPPRLPDRPKLAPGVQPAGLFKESAFVDPPWLIEREDAGYVHVTPLIYRVAELCTGENTYEDIARKLTEAGTPVQPQTIQRIVAQLLIPRGLVQTADGQVAQVSQGSAFSRINIRTKEIRPETIEPITNVLRWFYWPPVMIAVLAAAALVEVWLYFIHGVAGGLRDALNYPGLMLVMLGFITVAAAFHEVGHAAAMHYARQKIKGMGAGLYLVYPAFYTDVTNNYRLGRWQRLRTDLGGFYFNLIFVLGLMGGYLLTGQEVLLLVVLMINLEIIHQLLPFLRLDGYWALADVTGVPDFLTQMSAFVRQMVPGLRGTGQKMPELKWWGKTIFAAYMVVSLPLMAVLIFLMVKAAPRVFATAYSSALNLAHGFSTAEASGDVLGMGAALGQLLLLAIPTVGLAYTLLLLAKRFVLGVWRWSQPSWPRRATGGLAMAGLATLLAWLWWPGVPFGTSRPGQGGPAYAAASSDFRPISNEEHGTVEESVTTTWWNVPAPTPARPDISARATPQGSATPSPEASASAEASASPEASPSVQASSSPSPSLSPQPAASVPAGAVATRPAATATRAPAATSRPVAAVTPAPSTSAAASAAASPAVSPTTAPAVSPTAAAAA